MTRRSTGGGSSSSPCSLQQPAWLFNKFYANNNKMRMNRIAKIINVCKMGSYGETNVHSCKHGGALIIHGYKRKKSFSYTQILLSKLNKQPQQKLYNNQDGRKKGKRIKCLMHKGNFVYFEFNINLKDC